MSVLFFRVHNAKEIASAFLGMGVIIIMFPLPGYVAKLIQGVQTTKMKKVREPTTVRLFTS